MNFKWSRLSGITSAKNKQKLIVTKLDCFIREVYMTAKEFVSQLPMKVCRTGKKSLWVSMLKVEQQIKSGRG